MSATMATINGLQQVEFYVSIRRIPNVSFRAHRVVVPSMNMNPVERPTPFKKLYETSDTITYGDFSIAFSLDENLECWFEISKWMKGIAFPDKFEQFSKLRDSELGLRSDISINILTSKRNNNFVMTAHDCFPTSLSEITFDASQTDTQTQEMTVNFAYNGFEIEKAS